MWTAVRFGMASALRSLSERAGRTVLAGLGIVVGVAAIILLISTAEGVRRSVAGEIQQLGMNLIIVIPGRIDIQNPFSPASVLGISPLRGEDLRRVAETPGVRRATGFQIIAGGAASDEGVAGNALVVATTSVWFDIHPTETEAGRVLEPGDEGRRVCVLGPAIAREVFPSGGALGKSVRLLNADFEVIGVARTAEAEGEPLGAAAWDLVVYAPLQAMREVAESDRLHRIVAQTDPEVSPSSVVPAVREALRAARGDEQFTVVTQADITQLSGSVLGTLTAMLAGVTAIALFVGGIGVMNTMLMAVSERTREIGIRKAAGATRADIFLQFFIEAIVLTLLGGLVGFGLAMAAAALLRRLTPLEPYVSFGTVALAIAVCAGVGVVFGLIPAIRAASKDPVESLRYE